MALHAFSRTELLMGKPAMERLAQARVAVFGIGGVGSYTVEALARSGVGALDLIDDDRVCLTNITGRSMQPERRWENTRSRWRKNAFSRSIQLVGWKPIVPFTCRTLPHSLISASTIMW